MSHAPDWLVEVIRDHVIPTQGSGGTAYESYCVCSCGERNAISGGLREMALNKARRHVAEKVWYAVVQQHGEPRVIPSRTTDPVTSHKAATAVTVKAGTQRSYLLLPFYWQNLDHDGTPLGLTDEEAMNRAAQAGLPVSARSEYSKRCSELREAGLIEPTGETRTGASGHKRIVSRITDAGRKVVQGL